MLASHDSPTVRTQELTAAAADGANSTRAEQGGQTDSTAVDNTSTGGTSAGSTTPNDGADVAGADRLLQGVLDGRREGRPLRPLLPRADDENHLERRPGPLLQRALQQRFQHRKGKGKGAKASEDGEGAGEVYEVEDVTHMGVLVQQLLQAQ